MSGLAFDTGEISLIGNAKAVRRGSVSGGRGDFLPPDSSACRSRDEALIQLLAAATATFECDRDRAKAYVRQAAELLRVGLEREGLSQNDSFSRGGLAPWQVKHVADYIEANLGGCIRISDLAGIAQFSISYFFRAFRQSFGQSPLTYVTLRRIRHAQFIMLSTRGPLAQVALDCGMSDQAHFTRVFSKVVGISPSLWRRQFQSRPMSPEDLPRQTAGQLVAPPNQLTVL
jgi:AraC family transcriptional regulator